MASTDTKATVTYGPYPRIGTYPVAANTLLYKGCMIALDSSGRAVNYEDDGNGYNVVGVARLEVDNRTTAPSGGGAGAMSIDVEFGVFEFAYNGSAPVPRTVVYAYDNDTVSATATSAVSGFRGVAGVVIQTDSTAGTCRVFISAWTQDMADMAASLTALEAEVGDYTGGGGAEADVATGVVQAETDVIALELDANTAAYEISLSAPQEWRLSTGAAIPAFNDGVADGIALDDSEAVGLRINDDSTTTFMTSVKIPDDVDDTAALTLHVRGYRTGTTDTTTTLTVAAFAHETGDVHTDDADAGGSTTAFDHATADTITEETLAFAAGVLPAGSNVSLTFTVDANLDDDDLVILDAWLVGTRVQHTS